MTFASDPQGERVLNHLTDCGQRVWQRLEDRMHRFEEKFDKLSVPRARTAAGDGAETDD